MAPSSLPSFGRIAYTSQHFASDAGGGNEVVHCHQRWCRGDASICDFRQVPKLQKILHEAGSDFTGKIYHYDGTI